MLAFIKGHLFAVLLATLSLATVAGEQVVQGDIAPNWILADLKGEQASLYEQAEQGNWTVMVFWASWCTKCKVLLPKIEQLNRTKKGSAVSYYLMNVWDDKDPAVFAQEQDYRLPVIRQAEHVAQRYGIRITPGVVVVGPDKRIHYLQQPHESVTAVTKTLQNLLKIEPPSSQ